MRMRKGPRLRRPLDRSESLDLHVVVVRIPAAASATGRRRGLGRRLRPGGRRAMGRGRGRTRSGLLRRSRSAAAFEVVPLRIGGGADALEAKCEVVGVGAVAKGFV